MWKTSGHDIAEAGTGATADSSGELGMDERIVRVLVAAKVQFYGDALTHFLDGRNHIRVLGAVCDVEQTLNQLQSLRPDILLLDIGMPEGLGLARGATGAFPQTKVMAIAGSATVEEVLACAEAGVLGYVERSASAQELIDAIRHTVKGELICSPHVTASLFRRLAAVTRQLEENQTGVRLTSRETEVRKLVEEGLSNKQIALRLQIKQATVKNHVHSILRKTQSRTRTELIAKSNRHRARGPDGAAPDLRRRQDLDRDSATA